MSNRRRTLKRPLAVKLIAAGYLLIPVWWAMEMAVLYGVKFDTQALGSAVMTNHVIAMALSVVTGIAVLMVRRWSVWVFLAHGVFWLANNTYVYTTSQSIPLALYIVSTAALLGVVGFFLLTRVHAPYLNPRLRVWEPRKQAPVRLNARMEFGGEEIVGHTRELSRDGAVIECDVSKLGNTSTGKLVLASSRNEATYDISMRLLENSEFDGIAVDFEHMPKTSEQFLRELLAPTDRARIVLEAELTWPDGHALGATLDLSPSGAFVVCDTEHLEVGDHPRLRLVKGSTKIECDCEVVRIGQGDASTHGVGVRFVRPDLRTRSQIKRLVEDELATSGAK